MRKSFLTLMLAIVSSVWMMSEAACLAQAPSDLQPSYITVSGTIQHFAYPCEEGEECPSCLTWAIVTSDKTYYLSTASQQVQEFLDHMETAIPATYPLPLEAKATGIPYTQGSFDFMVVNDMDDLYVQYFSDQFTRLPSLCDEWNILRIATFKDASSYYTATQKLTRDTIIGEHTYVQSTYDHIYFGAFREGENRDIYFVPAARNKELLVYAWNAQAGDTLYNLLVCAYPIGALQYSDKAVVREIKETTPRTFIVDYEYRTDYADTAWWEYQWIEGVGMTCGPSGALCPYDECRGSVKSDILCAYKYGQQVYVSDLGELYGCKYYYDEDPTPGDTIQLYAQDDPGSSTVDPVDPNQVVAILRGNQLTIQENTGADVTYALHHNSPEETPSRNRAPQNDTFRDEVTIQITESGEYLLQLTNPSWGYTIFGQFYYAPQGIDQITNEPSPITTKVIKNGRLFILRGERVYTLTGQEVR